ncbi:hypothetical protein PoB_005144600 [Plakobranchus ocellatus]|uniref:Integrase catalytic domain-containing protein n=1 Tax=Plakobranchus ocellatus TaxID=259542 RepID=A0AAV4BNW3_9GAST|nr:hypothetical protein PoB_005144600 [Plakobranchus ocellatus]
MLHTKVCPRYAQGQNLASFKLETHIRLVYGISEELSLDDGPKFMSTATTTFLKTWEVNHRVSSVAFPYSNCRAEIDVKTVKCLITENTGPSGNNETDSFQRAIFQYLNTPDRDTHLSPAMCLFGRPIRDFIPIYPGKYQPHKTWQETVASHDAERPSANTWVLPPLPIRDCVRIQNQTGPHPTK